MPRAVPLQGFKVYQQADSVVATQPQQPTTQSTPSATGGTRGMLAEYGSLAKNALAPSSTGIAEGYNKVYDFATGFKGAPGTNLATGTTSSGTFGGSNIANAAYGYAGGKLANELFDNKGYSDIGGSVGASLGGAAAVGGTAAGASMGATFGSWAGPIGAIGGAIIGSAIGSLFGSGGISDSHFRSYSGELGDEVSGFNKEQAQRYGIAQRGGYVQREAGGKYQDLTTFAHSQAIDNYTFQNKIASTETPFGKYAVTFIDDMRSKDRLSFSNNWVDRVKSVDTAFAELFTPEQIEKAKKGLNGTVQASMEWEKKSQANVATADVLIDRYARIAQLAGRDDIYKEIITGAEGAKGRENGGITMLSGVIGKHKAIAEKARAADIRPTRASRAVSVRPEKSTRRRTSVERPEGRMNPAQELKYV